MAQAASAAPPATTPMWVQVARALECPRPASVLVALRQRLGVERIRTGEAPSGSLVLRVEPHGPRGMSARLSQAGVAIVERTIEVDAGECAGLAETLALVTETWLPAATAPSELGRPAFPPAPATPPGSAATEAVATPPGSAATEAVATEAVTSAAGAADRAPTEATLTPRSATKSDTPEPADPRDAALAEPAGGVAAGAPSASLPLALELALGSALGIDTILDRRAGRSPVALARAGAELNFSSWRFGLRGQFETPGDLDDNGTISIRRTSIEILLGMDVHRAERWALGMSLASGIEMLAVSGNYTRPVSGVLLEPSAAAGVRGEWRAFSRVGLTVALESVLALRRDRFLAGPDSWHTPRARGRISIGALWHLY